MNRAPGQKLVPWSIMTGPLGPLTLWAFYTPTHHSAAEISLEIVIRSSCFAPLRLKSHDTHELRGGWKLRAEVAYPLAIERAPEAGSTQGAVWYAGNTGYRGLCFSPK